MDEDLEKQGLTDLLRRVSASETARDFAQAATHKFSEAAREAGRHARTDASKLADQAGGEIKSFLKSKMGEGAGLAHEAAEAARAFASQIGDAAPTAAKTVRGAAGRVDAFAEQAGRLEPEDVLERVKDFARREPALFLGAAAAIGFVAARFLKSRAPTSETSEKEVVPGEHSDDA